MQGWVKQWITLLIINFIVVLFIYHLFLNVILKININMEQQGKHEVHNKPTNQVQVAIRGNYPSGLPPLGVIISMSHLTQGCLPSLHAELP